MRNEVHKVNSAVWTLLIARSPVLIVLFALFAVVRWMTTGADQVRREVLENIKIDAEEGEDLVDYTSRGSLSWLRAA